MYNVYVIYSASCYDGVSFVAAENAKEANKFIQERINNDPANITDSWGYCFVDEDDMLDDVFATRKGFVFSGIHYRG
mgnify:FL=1